MCTLIVGRDVLAPGSVIVAANRDEDPSRPSDPPGVLRETPRLVGGRDRRAGGTWLALREARAAVAVLNRPPGSPGDRCGPSPGEPGAPRRSRGWLVLDVASVEEGDPARGAPAGAPDSSRKAEARDRTKPVCEPGAPGRPEPPGDAPSPDPPIAVGGEGLSLAALRRALALLRAAPHDPFTLLFAAPDACWILSLEAAGVPRAERVPAGWHVITHADLDDPREPRTARLAGELAGFAPRSVEQAVRRLGDLLRSHGDPATGAPPVCLHEGRVVTVSASMAWLAGGDARYWHAEGPPCRRPFEDRSGLLRAPSRAGEPG